MVRKSPPLHIFICFLLQMLAAPPAPLADIVVVPPPDLVVVAPPIGFSMLDRNDQDVVELQIAAAILPAASSTDAILCAIPPLNILRVDDPFSHNMHALALNGWHFAPYLARARIGMGRLLTPIVWSLQALFKPGVDYPPILLVFLGGGTTPPFCL
jgi:hypothetical protein